jgi:very-short-patch-repair endonuclease
VIGRYIADFACRITRMLVVEADCDTHTVQETYDADRTSLKSKGYRVLDFTNAEVRRIWRVR